MLKIPRIFIESWIMCFHSLYALNHSHSPKDSYVSDINTQHVEDVRKIYPPNSVKIAIGKKYITSVTLNFSCLTAIQNQRNLIIF